MKRTDSTRRGRPRASSLEALQNHERFQLLVSSIRDYAVIILDREGRILTWNEGAERMKGWSADEIVGTSFEAFYPPEAVATGFPQEELEMAARDGRFEDENWRVRKDGSRFWANVVITALHGARGEVIGYGKVTRDLTDRREAEEQARRLAAERAAREEASKRSDELQELNARLQTALADAQNARDAALRSAAATAEAYAELDQFAYVASHDLKAPLRGIASLAQWIQDDVGEKLTGESADHMRLLHGRVQRMQGLIDGILVYSRAGRTLTTPERVQVGRLVDEVVELLPIPEGVIVDVQPEMPTLQAERVPLQQVFMNLDIVRVSEDGASDTHADFGASGGLMLTTSSGFGVHTAIDVVFRDPDEVWLVGVGAHYLPGS